jgi:hypothetical protein
MKRGQARAMVDELIPTMMVDPELVTIERAVQTLHDVFGSLVDAEYLPGKTQLRDVLAERFELSQLVAEELCDELERAERVRFVRTAEGAGWHIHADGDRA